MTQPVADNDMSGAAWSRWAAWFQRAGRFRRGAWVPGVVGGLTRFGAALLSIATAAAALLKRLRRRWRSSLQLRVVSTTMMVSAMVVSLLGVFLMQQITADLLRQAKHLAYNQASEGLAIAQTMAPTAAYGAAAQQGLLNIVNSLKSNSNNPFTDYGVAVLLPQDVPNYWWGAQINLHLQFLPSAVIAQVRRDRTLTPVFDFASMPYPKPRSPRTTGLLYADRFGGNYELYYFFPLTQPDPADAGGRGPRAGLSAGGNRLAGHEMGGGAGRPGCRGR